MLLFEILMMRNLKLLKQHYYKTVGRLGFEPRANRLKAEYSTIELATLENLGLTPLVLTDINHSMAL